MVSVHFTKLASSVSQPEVKVEPHASSISASSSLISMDLTGTPAATSFTLSNAEPEGYTWMFTPRVPQQLGIKQFQRLFLAHPISIPNVDSAPDRNGTVPVLLLVVKESKPINRDQIASILVQVPKPLQGIDVTIIAEAPGPAVPAIVPLGLSHDWNISYHIPVLLPAE